MNILAELAEQARALSKLLAVLVLLPLLALTAVVIGSARMGTPVGDLLSDPAAILDAAPWTGLISNFGALLWCATASISLFTWSVLQRRPESRQFSKFVLSAALITTVLLLDDLFLFHEWIFPRYLGVTERTTFSAYLVLIAVWLVLARRTILSTEYLILLLAFGFFGLSLFVDTYDEIDRLITSWRQIYEDGFKLLGIAAWFGYFSRCCFVEMRRTT
ncbi:MAG: hypothetical protein JSV45_05190 [Chromatiales bacterium]|nr:MAG: hypothetical protein JSV45_05190 [Chromatiales bacterium]